MRPLSSLAQWFKSTAGTALSRIGEGGTYRQLTAARGNRPDYITKVHSALQAEGIRVTYQVVGTGGGSPAGGIGAVSQTIKLLVHRDDLRRAHQIMARMGE